MSNNENNIETENKLLDEIKTEESDENVIKTEPKSDKKPMFTSDEELARLGLQPNAPDPAWCFCCIFCLEACLTPSGGAPPMPPHVRYGRKLNKMHNWDNDSNDDNDDNDNDGNGMEWAIAFSNNITGNHNSSSSGHHNDHRDHDDHDGGDGDGGGDGGGGGGDGGGD